MQELLRVRDLLGVNSFLPRESGTAPSGLPPTRGEATYLILSETQKGWENDKKSFYSRLKIKIQEEAEIVVGEDGQMGMNFQLSEFFSKRQRIRVKNEGVLEKIPVSSDLVASSG